MPKKSIGNMIRLLFTFIFFAITLCATASDVTIDKDNCTITKDGKTYNLWSIGQKVGCLDVGIRQ